MRNLSLRILSCLFIDIILIIVCVWHLPSIFHRAKTPFTAEQSEHRMVVKEIVDEELCVDLKRGDVLISWNDEELKFFETLEYYSGFAEI